MTFLYPELPADREASASCGQVSQEHSSSPPKPIDQTCPDPSNGEIIRHILIGSPEGVREAIHILHVRRYVEQCLWSDLVKIGEQGVKISRTEGEVLSYLVRQRSLDRPIR
ncbi:MAG: hypothetical protein ACFB4J_13025 [Elainellaceae cyanobacterium]